MSDQLGETLARLGKLTGFTPPVHTPQVNVLARSEGNAFLPYRPTPREPITPEIDAELDRLTRLDRLVYRHAERCFRLAVMSPGRRAPRSVIAA
jgi:hypothetical protein